MKTPKIATNPEELIPHRGPMQLLNDIAELNESASASHVTINNSAAFYQEKCGVPSWVGIEYMGQTAAMIAGYQLLRGITKPHLGFLLGTRKYRANVSWFPCGATLYICCTELAVVGDGLATFDCYISNLESEERYANAKLSVFRKPLGEPSP